VRLSLILRDAEPDMVSDVVIAVVCVSDNVLETLEESS